MKTHMKEPLDTETPVKAESKMKVVRDENKNGNMKNDKLKLVIAYLIERGKSVLLAITGLALFVFFWSLISSYTKDELPGPKTTLTVLFEMLRDPFYDYGPNDKGIGLQLMSSIGRVLKGFLLGSLSLSR